MNQPEQSNHDEPDVLDELLVEVFAGKSPPDLRHRILSQLHETPRVTTTAPLRSHGTASTRSRFGWAALLVLAAGLLVAIWWQRFPIGTNRQQPVVAKQSPVDVGAEPSPRPVPHPTVATAGPTHASPGSPASREPVPAPRTLAVGPGANGTETTKQLGAASTGFEAPNRTTQRIDLVSRVSAQAIESYWGAIGVEPSPSANPPQVIERLTQRLGFALNPTWFTAGRNGTIDDHSPAIRDSMRQPEHAEKLATMWLRQLTGPAIDRMKSDERALLVGEFAGAFQGEIRLDQLIAKLFSGESTGSSAWYGAISAEGEFALLHRLGSLAMNIDLRCIRCHDSALESTGRQSDYWSFAALVRRDVRRNEQGTWLVRSDDSIDPAKPSKVFYEREDGRQSVAEPSVPAAWLDSQSDLEPAKNVAHDIRQWSRSLVGSRLLARGLVNSFWLLIHDRPMLGNVADVRSTPLDDSLIRLHESLVDDVIDSGFDASRLMALVIASPATTRSTPPSLASEEGWAMNREQSRRDLAAVECFAAIAPSPKVLSLNQRIDLVMRAVGMTISGTGSTGPVLAQPLDSTTTMPRRNEHKTMPLTGFPDHVDAPTAPWLTSISDQHEQLKHLGYLAGLDRLPAAVETAASEMKRAGVNEELILARCWWLLQP